MNVIVLVSVVTLVFFNCIRKVVHEQQGFLSHSSGARNSEVKAPAWPVSSFCFTDGLFSLRPHLAGGREGSLGPLCDSTQPIRGRPSDLITSPRPHPQAPSHWGVRVQQGGGGVTVPPRQAGASLLLTVSSVGRGGSGLGALWSWSHGFSFMRKPSLGKLQETSLRYMPFVTRLQTCNWFSNLK